jgi:mRNA-degrading endonuclease RelE of RelBE toxin-antitoxin system
MQIRRLHPDIKPVVKSKIEGLREKPYSDKGLEFDLSGYFSIRANRFRVIYKIKDLDQTIEIHHVGHRKDIYELFKEAVTK